MPDIHFAAAHAAAAEAQDTGSCTIASMKKNANESSVAAKTGPTAEANAPADNSVAKAVQPSMLLMKGVPLAADAQCAPSAPPGAVCIAVHGGSPQGLWGGNGQMTMVPVAIPMSGNSAQGMHSAGPQMLYMLSQMSPMPGSSERMSFGASPPSQHAQAVAHFPDSPGMPDAAQMLLSPNADGSVAPKRRQLSPLVTGMYYMPTSGAAGRAPGRVSVGSSPLLMATNELLSSPRRTPVLRPATSRPTKLPLSPRAGHSMASGASSGHSSGAGSPAMQPAQFVLVPTTGGWVRSPVLAPAQHLGGSLGSPGVYAQGLVPAGVREVMQLPVQCTDANVVTLSSPSALGPRTGMWYHRSVANSQAYLHDSRDIDEDNITIIEVKQLLRRYGLNATGKKHVLLERIRNIRAALEAFVAREAAATATATQTALEHASDDEAATLCRMAISDVPQPDSKTEPVAEHIAEQTAASDQSSTPSLSPPVMENLSRPMHVA